MGKTRAIANPREGIHFCTTGLGALPTLDLDP